MNTIASIRTIDPVTTMIQEILAMIDADDARRLCAEQKAARKACLAKIRTLAIDNPQDARRLRRLIHTAKIDVLLQELRTPGTLSQEGLAKRVYEEFLLLLSTLPLRHQSERGLLSA